MSRDERPRDVHFLDEEHNVLCNPRDPEAAHRADVGDIKTTAERSAVTCAKCLRAMRAQP